MSQPIAAYREAASWYEWGTAVFQSYRHRIIHALPLRPGDTVIDVGCGTGLCLAGLRSRVGQAGTVIGIDPAPAMLQIARARIADHGWRNVSLIAGQAADVALPAGVDAALFCAVHDVLQSPAALANVIGQLRPGGWVAAGGGKFADTWPSPVNLAVATMHGPYVRSFAGFDRPWTELARHLEGLRVQRDLLDTFFIAVGRVRGPLGVDEVAGAERRRVRIG